MKTHYFLLLILCISMTVARQQSSAQTPKGLMTNVNLVRPAETNSTTGFPLFSTSAQIVAAFNKGRRTEEIAYGFPVNSLGIFTLPDGYATYTLSQKAVYIVNSERMARTGFDYGAGPVLGKPLEGAETGLNNTAQEHADYLASIGELSNTGPGGSSAFQRIKDTYATNCISQLGLAQSLYNGPATNILEAGLFTWIYRDAASDGNRQTILLQDNGNAMGPVPPPKGFTDDHGAAGSEGFLGVGVNGAFLVYLIADPTNLSGCQFLLGENPLPVRLVSWNAYKEGHSTLLQWETAWEENSDYFLVQRSTDSKSFNTIAKVTSFGTTKDQHVYKHLDTNPSPGINYYRLLQTDQDRSTLISRVVRVQHEASASAELAIFPNPASSLDVLHLKMQAQPIDHLALSNLAGQELPVTWSKEGNGKLIIKPTEALQVGIYLLQVTGKGKTESVRLMVR